jgi:hypothetical protein
MLLFRGNILIFFVKDYFLIFNFFKNISSLKRLIFCWRIIWAKLRAYKNIEIGEIEIKIIGDLEKNF